MTAHPLAAFEDQLELGGGWERIKQRTYIRCERFEIAHGEPLIARLEADPKWHTEHWDCGHSPHLTMPDQVVEAMINLSPDAKS